MKIQNNTNKYYSKVCFLTKTELICNFNFFMRRSGSSSKQLNPPYDTPSKLKKSQKTSSSITNKAPEYKENKTYLNKPSREEKYEYSGRKGTRFGSPKDSFIDITNTSLEASLSLASLKPYDYKMHSRKMNLIIRLMMQNRTRAI